MSQNRLILPVGIPAAGKTTLRSWLLENGFPADGVVSADDYRCILTGSTESQEANAAVFEIVETIVSWRLRSGLSVYVDNTNVRPRDRAKYLASAEAARAHPIVVRFGTPYEECCRRNDARSRRVPDFVMERMEKTFASSCGTSQLRAEVVGLGGDVFTPEEFMNYDWDFLSR